MGSYHFHLAEKKNLTKKIAGQKKYWSNIFGNNDLDQKINLSQNNFWSKEFKIRINYACLTNNA